MRWGALLSRQLAVESHVYRLCVSEEARGRGTGDQLATLEVVSDSQRKSKGVGGEG